MVRMNQEFVWAAPNDMSRSGRLEKMYRSHAEWLRKHLIRRCGAVFSEVDDLIQETYLRVTCQPEGGVTHPKAFLAQTALNLFRDSKRREAVRAEYLFVATAMRSVKERSIAGLVEQEVAFLFDQLVTDMPPLYRDVFALSRFRNMTNRDIAQHLGVSVKTVEWRLGKALEYCADKLRD